MELIDLLDEKGNIIGITDVETAHTQKQYHRVSAVFVFLKDGKLLIQEHVKSGGKYDNSIGGHAIKGETFYDAAKREAKEELNLECELTLVITFLPEKTKFNHYFALYECVLPESWEFHPTEEVKEIIFMDLDEIVILMNKNPDLFTHGFLNTMQAYLKAKGIKMTLSF